MPIQKIKDPQTGQEREVFAPKGLLAGKAPKPAAKPAPKPAEKPKGGGVLETVVGMAQDALQFSPAAMPFLQQAQLVNELREVGGTLLKTGDPRAAYLAGQQARVKTLEGPGMFRTGQRIIENVVRGAAQEASDSAQEFVFGKASTKQNPNLPFLGIAGGPLPKAESSGPIEDAVTNIGQFALGFYLTSKVLGPLGAAATKVPVVAKAAGGLKAAKAGYDAAKAAQLAKISSPALKAGAKAVAGAGEIVASAVAGKGAAAGFGADVLFVEPHEGRMIDTLDSVVKYFGGTPLANPVLDYIRSNPNDVGREARLKNGLDGLGGNAVVELGVRTFRVAKAVYRYFNAGSEKEKAEAAAQFIKDQKALGREINKQANTVPDEAFTADVTIPDGPMPPRYSEVSEMSPLEIVEPPRRGRKPKAEASPLAEPGGYQDELAGVIDVRRNPTTGQLEVVDGRKRLQLAKDSGVDAVLAREVPDVPARATPLADALEANMREMAQSDARVYRRVGQSIDAQRQGLDQLDEAALPPAAAAPEPRAQIKLTSTQRGELEAMNSTLMENMGIDLKQGLTRQQLEVLERNIRIDYASPGQGGIETVSAAVRRSMIGLADKFRKAADELPVGQAPVARAIDAPPAAAAAPEPSVPSAGSSAPAAGPSAAEIRELDELLARARADLPLEQRIALRDQTLAQKYGTGSPVEPPVAQAATPEPVASPAVVEAAGSPPPPPEPPVFTQAPVPDDSWGEKLARQIEANRQAIADGDMAVEDLLQNNVLKVESPSGRTSYVPDAPPEMVEAYRAHSDLISRPDATGIPVMTDEMIEADTAAWLERAQYNSKAVYQNLARLSGTLAQYRENLRALRAGMLLADHHNYQAGIAATRWINAAGEEAAADLPQRASELIAAAAAADRSNRAVMSVTRPIGQLMRSTQIPRPTPGSLPFDGVVIKDVGQEIQEFMVKEAEIPVSQSDWVKAVSPDLEDAIRSGDFTSPKVIEELDAIALNLNQASVTDGFGQTLWRNLSDIGSGAKTPPKVSDFNRAAGMGAKGLMFARNSFLLSAGETQWNNVINAAIRTFEFPFTTAVGSAMQGDLPRASRALMMYGLYVRNAVNSLRLGAESFKVGRGLFDMDRTSVDFMERLAASDAQKELIEQAAGKGEWTLSTVPWVDIQNKSLPAMAQKRIWQTLTLPGRLQMASDTAFKSLVGNSFERVRTFDLGLERAGEMGLKGKEAWDFANEYSKAAVERVTKDVTIEGRTILDAVMDSPHAQTAMRWTTFTDDIWAQMQPRTTTYGMKLATAKGLKDEAAQQFAMDYVTNGPKFLGTPLRVDDIPTPARAFSFLPKLWQMGLDSPMGPMFAALQPFNRTPGDIVKSVARKTPGINFFVDSWWRDVYSEDPFTRARAWGDVATGGMALSVGYIAMTQGRVEFTGGGPIEPQAAKRWREIEGKQPYSYRVRRGEDENGNPIYGPWESMRAFEPFASIIGGLADYAEISNKLTMEQRDRLGGSLVMDLMRATAAGQLQKSYYQGFLELYDLVTGMGELDATPNARNPVSRFMQRWIASTVPYSSALRSGRRVDDKLIRDIPASDNPNKLMGFFEELRNEMYNGLPGYSQNLPPRRNWVTSEPLVLTGAWGEQFLPPEQPWLSTLFQASPTIAFKKGQPVDDEVLKEMALLAGRGAGFIGPRATDFTEGGRVKGNRLDAYEYDEYLLTLGRVRDQFGRTMLQALHETIRSAAYKNAVPFMDTRGGVPSEAVPTLRAAMLNQVVTEYMQLGREAFLSGPYGKRLREGGAMVEGANRDLQYRLKYGQDVNPKAFVEALR